MYSDSTGFAGEYWKSAPFVLRMKSDSNQYIYECRAQLGWTGFPIYIRAHAGKVTIYTSLLDPVTSEDVSVLIESIVRTRKNKNILNKSAALEREFPRLKSRVAQRRKIHYSIETMEFMDVLMPIFTQKAHTELKSKFVQEASTLLTNYPYMTESEWTAIFREHQVNLVCES